MMRSAFVDAGWDVAYASYASKSFDVSTQTLGSPEGLTFSPDGTKMYVVSNSNDGVFYYTLSTAWDVSTASYVAFYTVTEDNQPTALGFNDDGTKMYVIGADTGDSVYQYTLSTAWNPSTASYDSVSLDVSTEDGAPYGMHFKSDGTILYICGADNDTVYQYTLSSAWDLSTAAYASKSFDISSQESIVEGVFVGESGKRMYIIGRGAGVGEGHRVFQYALSTAYDISTAVYENVSFNTTTQDTTTMDLFFKSDGTAFYVLGTDNDTVYQYTIAVS